MKLKGKTILITGGTGSFGQAFVARVLAQENPKAIRVYSRDELKQQQMRVALKDDERLRFLIGDVRDGKRLERACEGVDIIIHAAAMKQVPACEYNPIEAIRTNIDGAINVIEAALNLHTPKVIALSSDKAVHPVNLYGATKLCAEKLFVQANSYAGLSKKTSFSVVRYGNVVASRGSVIPLFKEQILRGEPLTLTDERMTRFWITLEQAVDFVVASIGMMKGGEIFVPKIPSMKIVDLVRAFNYAKVVKVIGIRPGEKIDEFLITKEEGPRTYELADRYVIEPEFPWWTERVAKRGSRMSGGFSYDSRNNKKWLTIKEMKKLIRIA
ncbi:MAG: UDP-N-acetylglucosamine 4,6-dehydratase (inverting) [Candidatus Spechtbacteria bacterium]|nr:UDP-N-acetylglucosamine 4,6-dehydratase (inverting) [Candidatus Spechtbacteria bacterium]